MAALLLAVAFCCGACRKREGVPFTCDCDYLTDYDDPANQAARVCAEDLQDALAVGHGCAQRSAPAPIRHCRCARASEPGPCQRGCLD